MDQSINSLESNKNSISLNSNELNNSNTFRLKFNKTEKNGTVIYLISKFSKILSKLQNQDKLEYPDKLNKFEKLQKKLSKFNTDFLEQIRNFNNEVHLIEKLSLSNNDDDKLENEIIITDPSHPLELRELNKYNAERLEVYRTLLKICGECIQKIRSKIDKNLKKLKKKKKKF